MGHKEATPAPLSLLVPLIACALVPHAAMVRGQSYPDRPLRMVTAEVGGGADFTARLIAAGLGSGLGQAVVVENRGGAGGALATQAVIKSPADGYTLLLYSGALWIAPLIQDAPWDAVRDFSPVSLAANSPILLVVHPSVPARSVKELVALAKAKPGALNYASGGSGSPPHLAGELFKSMAGVNVVRVAYKGIGAAIADLLSGQVEMTFGAAGSVVAHVASGRLRPLAVASAQPSGIFPALPTMAASGLPGFETETTYGIWVAAKTPAAVISRLNNEIGRVLVTREVKGKLMGLGVESVAGSPERLASWMNADMARMGKIIKEVGIRPD